MHTLLSTGWDDRINGSKLCPYHKPAGKNGRTRGEEVTPAGNTLVVFNSYMEQEVMPTLADR